MVCERSHLMMQQVVENYNLFKKVRERADQSYRDAAIEESSLQVALAEKTALEMERVINNLENVANDVPTDDINCNNEDPHTAQCIALYFIEEARKKVDASFDVDDATDSLTCYTNLIEQNDDKLYEKSDLTLQATPKSNIKDTSSRYVSKTVLNDQNHFYISGSMTAQSDSVPSVITTIT